MIAGLGVAALGGLVAQARHALLSVEDLPPPASQAVASSQVAAHKPPEPVPDPREGIIQEIQRACATLKEPGASAKQVAERLGTVTQDLPESVYFRPSSPYLTDGQVARLFDEDNKTTETPDWVAFTVADRTHLPVSALAAAFGEAREEREVADWGSPLPVSFEWPGQGGGKVRCQIGADLEQGNVVQGVTVLRVIE